MATFIFSQGRGWLNMDFVARIEEDKHGIVHLYFGTLTGRNGGTDVPIAPGEKAHILDWPASQHPIGDT